MGWIRGEKLGHGSFATVSLAVPAAAAAKSQSRYPPQLMAVKSCGDSLSSSLAAEKMILEELQGCPEIIRCFGDSFSTENGETLYNVLLEYAACGSLADRVKSSGDRGLPESEVRRYTAALLKGLGHVHRLGYVHCDVKLQNVLLCADGTVRVADFGLARRAGSVSSGCELRGTPMYMSPEMVAGGEQEAPADIWAVGCAVAEMAGGGTAWSGFSDVAALMMRIGVGDQVPDVPGVLSEEGKDFLGRCFEKDPTRRWTAEMLSNHPFVRDQVFDGGDDGCVASPEDATTTTTATSTSPRCPFGFPDWVSCSITSMPSPGYFRESESWFSGEPPIPAAASPPPLLGGIVSERSPDWPVSDDWVTVRH